MYINNIKIILQYTRFLGRRNLVVTRNCHAPGMSKTHVLYFVPCKCHAPCTSKPCVNS